MIDDKADINRRVEVIWREWDKTPPGGFGHGVQFHDVAISNRDNLVGFLDGFTWLHGQSEQVVVFCKKPDSLTPQRVLSTLKRRVEKLIAERQLPTGKITSRIDAVVNG